MFQLPPKIYDLLQKMVHGEYGMQRDIIASYLAEPRGKTLEIGCGTGILSRLFAPGSYSGADILPDRIAAARRLHPAHDFHVIDFSKDYSEFLEDYDTLLFHACIHHIDNASVTRMLANVAKAVGHRDRPMQIIAIEPCLPDKVLLNVPGFILAKLDRGKFVRSIKDYDRLFGGKIRKSERIKGSWYWPVPGVAYDIEVN